MQATIFSFSSYSNPEKLPSTCCKQLLTFEDVWSDVLFNGAQTIENESRQWIRATNANICSSLDSRKLFIKSAPANRPAAGDLLGVSSQPILTHSSRRIRSIKDDFTLLLSCCHTRSALGWVLCWCIHVLLRSASLEGLGAPWGRQVQHPRDFTLFSTEHHSYIAFSDGHNLAALNISIF